jgi:hypothetical protein
MELANINYSITPDEEDVFNAVQKIYKNGTISIEDLKDLSKDITSYYTPNLALPLTNRFKVLRRASLRPMSPLVSLAHFLSLTI